MKNTDIVQPQAMPSVFAEDVFSASGSADFAIPDATSSSATDTCVMDDGFLPITSEPLDDGGIAPERKNFNGLFYLSTDQRVFLQNGGRITFNASVSTSIGGYPTGAVLDYMDADGNYMFVESLVDDNTYNFITNPEYIDGTHWRAIKLGGNTRNIGEIVTSTNPLADAGLHLLDGTLLSGSGSYSAFVDHIADLYTADPTANYFTTEADWQTAVSTYGVCGKFVYNSVNNTVRLPKYGDKIDTQNKSITARQIPVKTNQTTFGNNDGALAIPAKNSSVTYYVKSQDGSGNVYVNNNSGSSVRWYADLSAINLNTQISGYYYIVVATSTKTAIQVDIDEIATDLNGKADVDLTNVNNTGKIAIAHNAMPSTTYTDLTLGASDAIYTAPADGYVFFQHCSTATGQIIAIRSQVSDSDTQATVLQRIYASGSRQYLALTLPVCKNQTYSISYTCDGTSGVFLRFVYAVGSESEAS